MIDCIMERIVNTHIGVTVIKNGMTIYSDYANDIFFRVLSSDIILAENDSLKAWMKLDTIAHYHTIVGLSSN